MSFRDLFGLSLRVHGKGGRDGVVPLSDSTLVATWQQWSCLGSIRGCCLRLIETFGADSG